MDDNNDGHSNVGLFPVNNTREQVPGESHELNGFLPTCVGWKAEGGQFRHSAPGALG